MKTLWLIVVAALLALAYYEFEYDQEITHAPGILAPDAPQQISLSQPRIWQKDEYRITALAQFSLEARVLSKERYWFGREADLSPADLALGWGPLSDQNVLNRLKISQSGRRYLWWGRPLPLPAETIYAHSANMHILPANEEVEDLLDQICRGDVVTLRGYLVAVQAGDGWRWRSSLSRTDRGDGACEVVWVESLAIRY
jgi:hypothetical protein